MSTQTMTLKILLPTQVLLEESVDKVVAEAENGEFCLLPGHVDFVAALASGILSFSISGEETFAAVDGGTLVKCGAEVLVSSRHAVIGDDLDRLHAMVENEFSALDEQERHARAALARLEAGTLRGFMRVRDTSHGR